jgi:hypothetical protein
MVATKLSEVAGKGWGWYSTPSSPPPPVHDGPSSSPCRFSLSSSASSASGGAGASSSSKDAVVARTASVTPTNLTASIEEASSSLSAGDSYYQWAKSSLNHAATSTYSGLAGVVSYLYSSDNNTTKSTSRRSVDDGIGGARIVITASTTTDTNEGSNLALSEDHSHSTTTSSSANSQGKGRRGVTLMAMVKDPASIVPPMMPTSFLGGEE